VSSTDPKNLRPIPGESIPVSCRFYIQWTVFSLLFLLASLVLLVLGLRFGMLEEFGFEGYLALAVLVIASFVGLVYCFSEIFREGRLVLGEDRVQLLRDADEVVGQIPYDNIAGLKYFHSLGWKGIGVLLIDKTRPDTIWPGRGGCWDFGRTYGCDILFTSRFVLAASVLFQKIFARWDPRHRRLRQ
jgi:hypothetical protein